MLTCAPYPRYNCRRNRPSRLGGGCIQVGVRRNQFRMLRVSNQQIQFWSFFLSFSFLLFYLDLSFLLYLNRGRGSAAFPTLGFSPVASGVEGEDLDETMAVGFAEARDVCGWLWGIEVRVSKSLGYLNSWMVKNGHSWKLLWKIWLTWDDLGSSYFRRPTKLRTNKIQSCFRGDLTLVSNYWISMIDMQKSTDFRPSLVSLNILNGYIYIYIVSL